ncbi:MAG: c-type cytochrome [Candidatus Rokuibacteriota bacterium]
MVYRMHRRQSFEQVTAVLSGMAGAASAWAGPAPAPRKTPSGDLLETVPRGDLPSFATIAYGRRDTPMFPSLRGLDGVRQLSEKEISDVVAYLRLRRRE